MRVVTLVPRREGVADRDRLWAFCRQQWRDQHPDWTIYEGHHDVGPFNRSAAVNRSAGLADWEQDAPWVVAVIIDADILIDGPRVEAGVAEAVASGRMVLPFDVRRDLSPGGTLRVLDGYRGSWASWVHRTYTSMVSGVVIVTRQLWDEVGGFDESFEGWGFEDNAFAAACQTYSGEPALRMPGELWHLYHRTAVEGKRGTATHERNKARSDLYLAAKGDRDATRALRATGAPAFEHRMSGIPRILHRVVPEAIDPQAEAWWQRFAELHPLWELRTHRDPLDPSAWPETGGHWRHAANGAQLADMIRLEAIWRWGGFYVDQDVEPYRSLEPLVPLSMVAGWEDAQCVPNAVLGAVPGHPAVRACLDLMLSRIPGDTWPAGPGVTTAVLPGRDDVLLLPPGSFYAVHYRDPDRDRLMADRQTRERNPWAFVLHHYWGSWLQRVEETA